MVHALDRGVELTVLRIFPTREQRRQVMSVLRSVQGPMQAKAHCLCCGLFEEDGVEEAILYMECWDSREEFERHVRSELYRRVLGAMEMSRVAPELRFHHVATTSGMELVEALRSEGANGQPG